VEGGVNGQNVRRETDQTSPDILEWIAKVKLPTSAAKNDNELSASSGDRVLLNPTM
jgi:hypothetical protein